MRICVPPLVIWRHGGFFMVATGTALGIILVIASFFLDFLYQSGAPTPTVWGILLLFFLPALPFYFSFQRTEFDNSELIARISYWVLIPVWKTGIPYQAVKGIGTDYRIIRMTLHAVPRPSSPFFDLFLYTHSRRCYLISRHCSEESYRCGVERILKHVHFRLLRFE
jgi:hypothetical protein